MKNFSMLRGLALCVLALLLSACDRPPKPPLVFGADHWPGYQSMFLARDKGYLPAKGIKVEQFEDADAVMQAFRSHKIQVAGMSMVQALQLRRDIPNLKIVLLFDASNGADAVLAQPGVTALAQLQGKRVGVGDRALGGYFLNLALQSAGLSLRQVSIVSLPTSQQAQAFAEHKVDALVTADPERSSLLKQGAVSLFDSSKVPGRLLDVMVTRDDDIGDYHEELGQLLQGWKRALGSMGKQPAGQGLRLLDLKANHEMILGDAGTAAASLDQVQRFMLNNGMLQVGMDASAILDPTLLGEIR